MQGAVLGHWIYLTGIGGLVVLRYLPYLKQARGTLPPELQILPQLLVVVAAADYGASLWMERVMQARSAAGRSAVHVVTAAFGVSIAVYGLVVWLLGGSTSWFCGFLLFALIHWFHSALRWQNPQPKV